MAGVRETVRKLKKLQNNLPQIAEDSMVETKDAFLELNKQQMYDGKNRLGENLTPSYLDDPYFKSRESAKRYSDWKDRITPSAKRPSGTPNLYISGAYYNSQFIQRSKGGLQYNASTPMAAKIEAKYPNLYGLSAAYKIEYINLMKPIFFEKILSSLK
jgi:hypothetical protein